jgi:hypothetical protein
VNRSETWWLVRRDGRRRGDGRHWTEGPQAWRLRERIRLLRLVDRIREDSDRLRIVAVMEQFGQKPVDETAAACVRQVLGKPPWARLAR